MIDLEQIHDSIASTPSKIVLLVADGLGGLPHPDTRKSELETANIPNLDALAQRSACGLTTPVEVGVAPGSGPGHLALFGYNPLKYIIGRGALEALGVGVELLPGDVAARGNFCTVDDDGLLTDRRAGRIATSLSAPLCERLDRIEIPGVQVDVFPGAGLPVRAALARRGLVRTGGGNRPAAGGNGSQAGQRHHA